MLGHASFLRDLAARLVPVDLDPEDLVQDVLVTSMEHPPAHRGNLRGWLRTVTWNRLLISLRADRRRERREWMAARPESQPSVADEVADRQVLQRVSAAVLALAEPYRSVVLLRFFHSLPPRVIAARLERPLNTVNSQLKRGLAQLRAQLGEEDRERLYAWNSAAALRLFAQGAKSAAPRLVPAATYARAWLVGLPVVCVAALLVAGLTGGPGRSEEALAGLLPTASAAPSPTVASNTLAPQRDRRGTPAADPSRSARTATYEVRVLDERGMPRAGATVATFLYTGLDEDALGHWQPVGVTDADGTLRVPVSRTQAAVPRGFETVGARVGWLAWSDGHPATRAVFQEEASSDPVQLRLPRGPAVSVRGRVVDEAGEPVPRARVTFGDFELEPTVTPAGHLEVRGDWHDLTDAAGRFELPHLAAGRHLLFVGHRDHVRTARWIGGEGHEATDLVLTLRRGAEVRGRVLLPDGGPAAGALVGFDPTIGGAAPVRADDRGRFRLTGVEPGARRLHARAAGHRVEQVLELERGAVAAWNPTLAPETPRTLVVRRGGVPLAHACVVASAAADDEAWTRRTLADAAGRVDLSEAPRGPLVVTVYRDELDALGAGFALTAGRVEGAGESTLDCAAVDAVGELHLELTPAAREKAWLLVTQREHGVARRYPLAADDGRLSLRRLPPGTYDLSVWSAVHGVWDLGSHLLEDGEELDLGRPLPPVPQVATVSCAEGARELRLLDARRAGATWSLDAGLWPIDERPVDGEAVRYALWPGTYTAELGTGRELRRRVLEVAVGREARLDFE